MVSESYRLPIQKARWGKDEKRDFDSRGIRLAFNRHSSIVIRQFLLTIGEAKGYTYPIYIPGGTSQAWLADMQQDYCAFFF
jgi:hypothetical protein